MNTTTNSCTTNPVWPTSCYRLIPAILTILVSIAAMVIIVFGNFLVVLAVLKEAKLRKAKQYWLIVSLAVADLLVGWLIMPFSLAFEILGTWVFGSVLCEIWLALDVLFVTSSILNLCAISLDRYWCIVDPLQYPRKRTKLRIALLITLTWFISFFISFPPLVGWRPERQEGECFLSNRIDYVLYSSFGSFWVPIAVLIFVYVRIFAITRTRMQGKLKQVATQEETMAKIESNKIHSPTMDDRTVLQKVSLSQSKTQSLSPNKPKLSVQFDCEFTSKEKNGSSEPQMELVNQNHNHEIVSAHSDEDYYNSESHPTVSEKENFAAPNLRKQFSRKRKALKRKERVATMILGFILVSFIACWLPFFFCYTVAAFGVQVPNILFTVFFWIGYCNSGFNPVIYAAFNPEFQQAFRKILRLKTNRRTYL